MINATPLFRPKLFAVLALSLSLSACSSMNLMDLKLWGDGDATPTEEHPDWTAQDYYQEAKNELTEGHYEKAAKLYEKLEARYPFGPIATQAQMDIAYAYYKNSEWESSLAAADRFIKLYPAHERVDYAYYLRGLVNYNKGKTFVDRFLPTDSSQRDPGAARESMRDFGELIAKFPNSKYAEDAKLRLIALRNNLAMYEYHVADYYLRRGAYVASARRCNGILEKYPRTHAVPLALKLLEESYRKLELNDLANDAARIFAVNYGPGAPNARYAEEQFDLTPAEIAWDFIGFDH
ncbi:MAG: outer membrane protein assembly factor BamD [Candidatus Methylumidiphilus sp.]